jgi:glyoxylase-like metal-dependent hydrolase (beta-lactamase superfamily II)
MKSILILLFIAFFSASIVAQQTNTYEVYAIEFARPHSPWPVKGIAVNSTSKDSVRGVFMTWLLKGNNGRMVLVDAGFHRESRFSGAWLKSFVRPDSSLQLVGLKPEDITDIIISHPHWDHIGGVDLFPKAVIWMQKNDYSYFVTDAWQKDGKPIGFDSLDVLKIADLNTKRRIQLVNGDNIEIIPGIKVYTGSKHTYESQFAVVNTTTDKVLVASDNIWFYYNLENMISIPLTFDTEAYVKTMQRMKTLVRPELIIPGHDEKIFEKFTRIKEEVVRIR